MSRLTSVIAATTDVVAANARELNRLDAQAGDGDLGVTMSIAAKAVRGILPDLEGAPAGDVFKACGLTMAREAPSTAGTLIASGLLAVARTAAEGADADVEAVARLLEAAREGVVQRGKAEVGSKTMLDALVPAAEAARQAAAEGTTAAEALRRAARAADEGAKATVDMVPRHGRAGWLAERSAGHEDGGARLIAVILAAVAESVEGSGAPGDGT